MTNPTRLTPEDLETTLRMAAEYGWVAHAEMDRIRGHCLALEAELSFVQDRRDQARQERDQAFAEAARYREALEKIQRMSLDDRGVVAQLIDREAKEALAGEAKDV